MPVRNRSPYPLRVSAQSRQSRRSHRGVHPIAFLTGGAVFVIGGLFFVPKIVTIEIMREQSRPVPVAVADPFPVSVDTHTKSIVEDPRAEEFFQNQNNLTAAVDQASYVISWFASLVNNSSWYQSLASPNGRMVTIYPGYRKEQVMNQLVKALNWNKQQQDEFLADVQAQTPGITEGMFSPGTYVVDPTMTPANVAALMNLAFNKSILLHYGTTTAQHVPLSAALTVASLLEREAAGATDMREISGIIWNRLFNGMNLQIDATLQYAKGQTKNGSWWSAVAPKDKYVKSPYNTYAHPGLPPGPIANPSVAAVVAALNPISTDCLFYFHDKNGQFHCTKDYADHVKLLKKYYGQGK